MAARTRRSKYALGLKVDERTDGLSDAALYCRMRGHKWEERALGKTRFLELLGRGLSEYHWVCDNGCGWEWIRLWDVHTGEIVGDKRTPPKDDEHGRYTLSPGSGRLPRAAARVAQFARQYPHYA
jgi:hypothetical protein